MNRQEAYGLLRTVVDGTVSDYTDFSTEAVLFLLSRARGEIDRLYEPEETIADALARRRANDFSKELRKMRERHQNEDVPVTEKSVSDWITSLCPGFWPFC